MYAFPAERKGIRGGQTPAHRTLHLRARRRANRRLLDSPCIGRPSLQHSNIPRGAANPYPYSPRPPDAYPQPPPPHCNSHRDLPGTLRCHNGSPSIRYPHPHSLSHAYSHPYPVSLPDAHTHANPNPNAHHPHAHTEPHSNPYSERTIGQYPGIPTSLDRRHTLAHPHTDAHSRAYRNTISNSPTHADAHSRAYRDAIPNPHTTADQHAVSYDSPERNRNSNALAVPNPHSHHSPSAANPCGP